MGGKEKPAAVKGRKRKNGKKKGTCGEDFDDENNQQKDQHVFKVPSLESFRSQKNKSSKLMSPNASYEESAEFGEVAQDLSDSECEAKLEEVDNKDMERSEGSEGSDSEDQEGLDRKK